MSERIEAEVIAPVLRLATFSSMQKNAEAFAARVVAMLPAAEPRRVLEIGSGLGDAAMYIGQARPLAEVTGVDFSPSNVAAAQARARARGAGIAFARADYLDWRGGRFDLIAADSVLHLVDAPLPRLAAKLAADLAPGGFVVATVPDAGMLNRTHLLLRRLWRCMPSAADRVVLAVASCLYPDMSREVLADRLPYLRLLPRLFGPAEHRAFAATGLVLERSERWPGASVAKPRHWLVVWRLAATAEHTAVRW